MESDLPDVAGMVTDGKLLILPNGTGKVRCFDVLTGKRIWTQEYDNGFWSNPTLNGDLVYMTDMEGTTFIFKLADKYEEVGQGKFGEPVLTSFAVADSRFYVRGEKYLYCLGKPQ
ncbi:MAG: PQQ-binding-like beta-propeller repeat protein [Candidatus Omnitrophica bacterium]|nr:PQQ-binding-like beta-propeller repeat protein [Candidatus Omnitrophota bacterium]